MKNKYVFRSHISERQIRGIIRYFSIDVEASKIALLTGISTNSLSKIPKAVRLCLFKICEQEAHCHENVYSNKMKATLEQGGLVECVGEGPKGRQ